MWKCMWGGVCECGEVVVGRWVWSGRCGQVGVVRY